jgi:hypothetical protein
MTPGLWEVNPSDPCVVQRADGEGPLDGFVAMTLPAPEIGWDGTEETEANARAIAALPELVSAARAVLQVEALTPGDCYDADGRPNVNHGVGERARAALRAALEKAGVRP